MANLLSGLGSIAAGGGAVGVGTVAAPAPAKPASAPPGLSDGLSTNAPGSPGGAANSGVGSGISSGVRSEIRSNEAAAGALAQGSAEARAAEARQAAASSLKPNSIQTVYVFDDHLQRNVVKILDIETQKVPEDPPDGADDSSAQIGAPLVAAPSVVTVSTAVPADSAVGRDGGVRVDVQA
jgi:hypothetical protein